MWPKDSFQSSRWCPMLDLAHRKCGCLAPGVALHALVHLCSPDTELIVIVGEEDTSSSNFRGVPACGRCHLGPDARWGKDTAALAEGC